MAQDYYSSYDMQIARAIFGFTLIYLLQHFPIQSAYVRSFLRTFISGFVIGEFVNVAYAVVLYLGTASPFQLFLMWKLYELIRAFLSFSLLYPIFIVLGKDTKQLQTVMLVVVVIILGGLVYDFTFTTYHHSGMHNVAFLVIFCFTYMQYKEFASSIEGNIPHLSSLMNLELILIGLLTVYILLFFSVNGGESIRTAIGLLQYIKFYLLPTTMGSVIVHKAPV